MNYLDLKIKRGTHEETRQLVARLTRREFRLTQSPKKRGKHEEAR